MEDHGHGIDLTFLCLADEDALPDPLHWVPGDHLAPDSFAHPALLPGVRAILAGQGFRIYLG